MECKYCLAEIKKEVLKCKHCGEWVNSENDVLNEKLQIISQRLNSIEKIFKPKIAVKKPKEIEETSVLSETLNILDLINLKKGDEVFHPKLGRGKVLEMDVPYEIIESVGRLKGSFKFEQREEPFKLLLPLTKIKRVLKKEGLD